MAYEQRDNTGSLFKNDRKESDTHPDYKGSALINGVDHWLDAWINTDRNGSKYMSLKLKPKSDVARAANADTGVLPVADAGIDSTSDSVPF
jgi:uncharacterized protein (DUF736 family)